MMPLVSRLNNILTLLSLAGGRIDGYIDRADNLTFFWKLAALVKSAFPCLIAILFSKRRATESLFYKMLLLQLLFCAGAFSIPVIFSRFTNYTALFVVISLANEIVRKQMKPFTKGIIICFVIMTQVYYYKGMYTTWIPYVSIFNPRIIPARERLWWEHFGH